MNRNLSQNLTQITDRLKRT